MAYSLHDFIHPEDQQAREQLEAIPGFQALARTLMQAFNERVLHGLNMAGKIRLGPRQLPALHAHLPPICEALGIPEPELYLEMDPRPNAYTYGDTRIFVTLTSGLVEHLEPEELRAVVAHECGHVVCRHTLYLTMIDLLRQGVSSVVARAALPALLGLLAWMRRSEYSADRAAAVALGSPASIVDGLVRLCGGPRSITGALDVELFAQQAEEYEELKDASWWDGLLQGLQVMWMTHPLPAVRVRELRRWCAGEAYARLRDAGAGGAPDVPAEACADCGRPLTGARRFCRHCGAAVSGRTM
jgi:Zn-dependent protease with chaperone function